MEGVKRAWKGALVADYEKNVVLSYMSRARKERSPVQLAVLAQAHEKARIVDKRAELNALAKKDGVSDPSSEPVLEDSLEPEPCVWVGESSSRVRPPEPEAVPVSKEAPRRPPPEPASESEKPRSTRREVSDVQETSTKYRYIQEEL